MYHSPCGSFAEVSAAVVAFETRGPRFKYQPRDIQPSPYFGLGHKVWGLKPEVPGSNAREITKDLGTD